MFGITSVLSDAFGPEGIRGVQQLSYGSRQPSRSFHQQNMITFGQRRQGGRSRNGQFDPGSQLQQGHQQRGFQRSQFQQQGFGRSQLPTGNFQQNFQNFGGQSSSNSRQFGSAFSSAGLPGFGNNEIDINSFGMLNPEAFGFEEFGRNYINVEDWNFNTWRDGAQAQAPQMSFAPQSQEQAVIGTRFRSGSARQTETSTGEKTGSGSGEGTVELSATRSGSNDVTQSYSQTGSGEGTNEERASYGFQKNPNFQFQTIQLEAAPVHSGPASTLPDRLQRGGRQSAPIQPRFTGRGQQVPRQTTRYNSRQYG